MNFVERTTWQLVEQLITGIDPNREGWCIDAGAGVQDFYFEWFNNAKYKTVLIEPMPVKQALDICANDGIPLIEAAIAAQAGIAMLAVHDDPNRHTLRGDLWPNDYDVFTDTQTVTLADVVAQFDIDRITALKLDIEGAEPQVLQTITVDNAPDVIAFEFGGQVRMREGTGAWSPESRKAIYDSLDHLQSLGYKRGAVIVASTPDEVRPFEVGDSLFNSADAWGNIITWQI